MKPEARTVAAVELLEAIFASGRPADGVVREYFKARRYAGAKDRAAIAETVWTVLRRRRRLEWWTKSAAPADLVAALVGAPLAAPDMPEAVRCEVPDWLLPELREAFGDDLVAEFDALNVPAPVDLRVNTSRASRAEVATLLAAEGLDAAPCPRASAGLRLTSRRPPPDAWRDGLVEPMDEGSQLVALAVGAEPGMAVCDYCAGAGGKTLALADAMRGQGRLVACDVSARRLDGLSPRLARADVRFVERHVLGPPPRGAFDRVLCDVPCSGSGVWRRQPDARLRLRPEHLTALMETQRQILDRAAPLVRPGGRLVYATCSVLPSEDERQVEAFLVRRPDYRQIDALRLSPLRDGTDGFFAAVLERAILAE